jgi:hypothetical protein
VTPDSTPHSEASDIRQELDVLGDAVLLLMRRRRDSDTWIGDQLRQAEQRAADAERRYADLEWRLAAIETHLQRLAQEVQAPADESRIALLREEIRGLGADQPVPTTTSAPAPLPIADWTARPQRSQPVSYGEDVVRGDAVSARDVGAVEPRGAASPIVAPELLRSEPALVAVRTEPVPPRPEPAAVPAASPRATNVSFWQVLGANRQDRTGVVLMGIGAVGVLYALLTQVRLT